MLTGLDGCRAGGVQASSPCRGTHTGKLDSQFYRYEVGSWVLCTCFHRSELALVVKMLIVTLRLFVQTWSKNPEYVEILKNMKGIVRRSLVRPS